MSLKDATFHVFPLIFFLSRRLIFPVSYSGAWMWNTTAPPQRYAKETRLCATAREATGLSALNRTSLTRCAQRNAATLDKTTKKIYVSRIWYVFVSSLTIL